VDAETAVSMILAHPLRGRTVSEASLVPVRAAWAVAVTVADASTGRIWLRCGCRPFNR
jgi:hypothetical protein